MLLPYSLSLSALALAASISAAPTRAPDKVFGQALEEMHGRAPVPIVLPTKLPAKISASTIKLSAGTTDENGYQITLCYSESCTASFAASFSGTKEALPDLPQDTKIKLSNGAPGIFRPVSCGGSCAPANLWWRKNGATYQIQFKLNSLMPELEQKNLLVETANSSVSIQ